MRGNKPIQVYEYGWLIVNEKYGAGRDIVYTRHHFELMANYLTKNPGCPFYTVYLNRIRFANFVGVIKVQDLTIEILPKTDRHDADESAWQKVLMQMMAISLDVKAKTSTHAEIVLRNHNVLETYLFLFLQETERLLHDGLVKKYRTATGNQSSLKGKLLVHQQVTRNLIHAERFYVAHPVYDRNNIYNSILQEALFCIQSLNVSAGCTKYCKKILLDFPDCNAIKISEKFFTSLVYDRKTERYRMAIELARIILLNYHPDIKSGTENILAIMFDMNLLWESFIYRMLLKAKIDMGINFEVLSQRFASFWKHPAGWTLHLVPDLLIKPGNGEKIILDTKWKYRGDTSPEDIRQMYAYGDYFGAHRRYLLYPDKLKEHQQILIREGNFYGLQDNQLSQTEQCSLAFIDPLNPDKSLNLNIGKVILSEIIKG